MGECVREVCMLSVLFGVLLAVTPEGSIKRISAAVCSAALITAVLSSVKETELSVYREEVARSRERSASITQNAQDSTQRLSRLVIEHECEAYIIDRADSIGISGLSVKVSARWSGEGFWLPESAVLSAACEEGKKALLGEILETELGVAKERQTWTA